MNAAISSWAVESLHIGVGVESIFLKFPWFSPNCRSYLPKYYWPSSPQKGPNIEGKDYWFPTKRLEFPYSSLFIKHCVKCQCVLCALVIAPCCTGGFADKCFLILYVYHWSCRCGRVPPQVRTAINVDGWFEHMVLSSNSISDHGIVWIEKEAEKALQVSYWNPHFSSAPNL